LGLINTELRSRNNEYKIQEHCSVLTTRVSHILFHAIAGT